MKGGKKEVKTERRIRKAIIGKGHKLYVKTVFTELRRGKRKQDENNKLVHIKG